MQHRFGDELMFPIAQRILTAAGLIRGKKIKQWTFYKRDEKRIAEVKRAFGKAW